MRVVKHKNKKNATTLPRTLRPASSRPRGQFSENFTYSYIWETLSVSKHVIKYPQLISCCHLQPWLTEQEAVNFLFYVTPAPHIPPAPDISRCTRPTKNQLGAIFFHLMITVLCQFWRVFPGIHEKYASGSEFGALLAKIYKLFIFFIVGF